MTLADVQPTPDDKLLVERVAARDSAALSTLYDRHSPMVFALCLRVLRDRGEAEQVLIDVFAEFWDHASRFDLTRGSVKGYLALLGRSRAIDLARKRPAVKLQSLNVGDSLSSATNRDVPRSDHGSLVAERKDLVASALAALSNEQRDAIELAFFEGLTHQEVATQLKRPLGTVKAQIRTGLARMRDGLKRYWEGGSQHDMR